MARGSNLEWIQAMGGGSSAKLLLDADGHDLPAESTGYADALTAWTAPDRINGHSSIVSSAPSSVPSRSKAVNVRQ